MSHALYQIDTSYDSPLMRIGRIYNESLLRSGKSYLCLSLEIRGDKIRIISSTASDKKEQCDVSVTENGIRVHACTMSFNAHFINELQREITRHTVL